MVIKFSASPNCSWYLRQWDRWRSDVVEGEMSELDKCPKWNTQKDRQNLSRASGSPGAAPGSLTRRIRSPWSRRESCKDGKNGVEEVMAEIFPNLAFANPWFQETQWTPRMGNIKETIPRYVISKLLKTSDKKKMLEEPERRHLLYKEHR